MKSKILLVEDDPSLGFVIKDNLLIKGYDVRLCNDGEEGQKAFTENHFDLCILDVMMPKKDGFSLAKSIRENAPVLESPANGFNVIRMIELAFESSEKQCSIPVTGLLNT